MRRTELYIWGSRSGKQVTHVANPRPACRDDPCGGGRGSRGRIRFGPPIPSPSRRGPVPEFEDVLYEVGAGRATITINRPDRLNAFRRQTVRELAEAFEAAADDEA